MIAFNHTIKIVPEIEGDWLEWLQETHLPEIMATQLFDSFKIYHLLELDDEEGKTYTIQFFTTEMQRYRQFMTDYCPAFDKKAFARWGQQFVGFRTIMELVN